MILYVSVMDVKQRNTFTKCSFNQNACSFKDCHVNEFITDTMLMTLKFH